MTVSTRIMEAHRGTIDVIPREGGGSIFLLAFPGALVHPDHLS
jgi:signal transduction histidine kinase